MDEGAPPAPPSLSMDFHLFPHSKACTLRDQVLAVTSAEYVGDEVERVMSHCNKSGTTAVWQTLDYTSHFSVQELEGVVEGGRATIDLVETLLRVIIHQCHVARDGGPVVELVPNGRVAHLSTNSSTAEWDRMKQAVSSGADHKLVVVREGGQKTWMLAHIFVPGKRVISYHAGTEDIAHPAPSPELWALENIGFTCRGVFTNQLEDAACSLAHAFRNACILLENKDPRDVGGRDGCALPTQP